MSRNSTATELQWELQERDERARKRLEQRQWMKGFAFGLGLIVVTVAAAAKLAQMFGVNIASP